MLKSKSALTTLKAFKHALCLCRTLLRPRFGISIRVQPSISSTTRDFLITFMRRMEASTRRTRWESAKLQATCSPDAVEVQNVELSPELTVNLQSVDKKIVDQVTLLLSERLDARWSILAWKSSLLDVVQARSEEFPRVGEIVSTSMARTAEATKFVPSGSKRVYHSTTLVRGPRKNSNWSNRADGATGCIGWGPFFFSLFGT